MIRLSKVRKDAGWSQRELGRRSNVDASYISNAENRRFVLYANQAKRVADALGWKEDPMLLFEEIGSEDFDGPNHPSPAAA